LKFVVIKYFNVISINGQKYNTLGSDKSGTVDRTGKRFPKPLKTQATYGNYDIGKCWQTMLYFWSLTIGLWFMVVNDTFKTFSVILWRSVLFVEETGVPVASYWQTYINKWSEI
jgi:hypothetical protein